MDVELSGATTGVARDERDEDTNFQDYRPRLLAIAPVAIDHGTQPLGEKDGMDEKPKKKTVSEEPRLRQDFFTSLQW